MDAHNIEFYCNLKKKFLEGREKNEKWPRILVFTTEKSVMFCIDYIYDDRFYV